MISHCRNQSTVWQYLETIMFPISNSVYWFDWSSLKQNGFNLRLWKGEYLEDLYGGNVKQGFVDPYAPSSQDQSQRKPPTIKVSGESAADISSCVLTVSMKVIGNTFERETLVRIKVSASQDPKKMLNDGSRPASLKNIAPKKPFLMEALGLHWTTYF